VTDKQQDFEEFVRVQLDESVDGMDAATRMRLAAIRHKALASDSKPPRRGWLLPASLATAMAAFVLIWMLPQQQVGNGLDVAMEDMELLASDIDVELLEDIEFYQWLQASNHAG